MNPFNHTIIIDDMHTIYNSNTDWNSLYYKSVYITGSTGMLATYFVWFLIYLNEYHNMHIEIYAGIRHIEKAKNRFGLFIKREYFHIVLKDANEPLNFDSKINYIIHAASLASPQYYGKSPVETMLPNIIGTYELLKYAAAEKIDGMLFFSSDSIYGRTQSIEAIAESDIGLFDFSEIGNFYGESKRSGEALCKAYSIEYGVPAKSIRIHHTYGPSMDIKNDKRVFADFVQKVVEGKDIILNSDGSAKRTFCYITDTISAMFLILFRGQNGLAYNVGNPNEYLSIKDLAYLMTTLSEKKITVVDTFQEADEDYQPRTDVPTSKLSINRIREIGWSPKVSAVDGFRRCIEFFMSEVKNRHIL